jgi:hypothetical protein
MKILVIGQYCWGKGDTEEEAKLKARQSGGREGLRRYLVYEVSDETWVDDMGDLCRNHASPFPRLLKRVVGRKVEIVAPYGLSAEVLQEPSHCRPKSRPSATRFRAKTP